MIKFEFLPSAGLKANYDLRVVPKAQEKMNAYVLGLPVEYQARFRYFDNAKINEILSCAPSEILSHIYDIYDKFPELADRYWPAYLIKDAPIPMDIDQYGAQTQEDKAILNALSAQAIAFLEPIAVPGLTYINYLLKSLREAATYSAKRDILADIAKASQGDNLATKRFKDIFDGWVNDFEKIFSYSALSSDIGHDITDEWKINICLYCNDEPIETKGKRVRFRTDLDHFYPKTKFPFLAVTLSNLVPSGKTCNQSYKGNKDMIEYEHPFVRGVGQSRLFHLNTPFGEKITEENFSVDIMGQGGKLDLNLSEFEIAHNYGNSDEVKSWVADAAGTVELIVGLNDSEVKAALLSGLIKVDKPAHRERYKKFKVDSINQFAGKEIISFA